MPGGSVTNWSRVRLALSRMGNAYARLMLGLPLHDATSGYRAYRRELLQDLVAEPFHADGYGFQVELVMRPWLRGWTIGEVPITFREREHGHSKLSRRIVVEALWLVTRWGIALRAPRKAVPRSRPPDHRDRELARRRPTVVPDNVHYVTFVENAVATETAPPRSAARTRAPSRQRGIRAFLASSPSWMRSSVRRSVAEHRADGLSLLADGPVPRLPVGCGPTGRQTRGDHRASRERPGGEMRRPKHRARRRGALLAPVVLARARRRCGAGGILGRPGGSAGRLPRPSFGRRRPARHRRHPVLERRLWPARLRSRRSRSRATDRPRAAR